MPPTDSLAVELEILDQTANIKIDTFRGKLKLVSEDINKVGGDKQFAAKIITDLGELSKRADAVHRSFQEILKTRIDGGQIGSLTREIAAASQRSQTLASDIINIRRELANPNRTSSIAFLTSELKAAEREADVLTRKLNSLPAVKLPLPEGSGLGKGFGGGSRRGSKRLGETGRAILEIADDFVPQGFNKPFNAVTKEIAANIESIPKSLFVSAGILGGIAAIGYGLVKISQNIREEAERYLKLQEGIAIAGNNQILGRKKVLEDLKKERELAAGDRRFSRSLNDGTVEELHAQRANAQLRFNLSEQGLYDPKEKRFVQSDENKRLGEQLKAFDAQIETAQANRQKQQSDSFSNRFDAYRNSQEQAQKSIEAASEKQRIAQERFNKSVEEGKNKVAELGKTYNSVFDTLFARANSNNPFASLFSEADKSLRTLRDNIKGLPEDLQQVFIGLEQNANRKKLFETRIDNSLSVFDLKDRASQFRNFREPNAPEIKDKDQFFKDFIASQTADLGKNTTRFENTANSAGFNQTNLAEQLKIVFERVGGLGVSNVATQKAGDEKRVFSGFFQREKTFADLTESEKSDFLRKSNKTDDNSSLQERLSKQVNIIESLKNTSGLNSTDAQGIADKKILGLSSGIRPEQLNDSLRNAVALANEREAVRKDQNEKEAIALQKDAIALQGRIAIAQEALLKIAQTQGLEGLKQTLEIIDKTNGAVKVLGASPKPEDTATTYRQYQNAL